MKKGFTLAEVLITLAVIGVVAALTIPALITKYQKKQYYSAFMKEFNTLSTAFQMAQGEHGSFNSWSNMKAPYIMAYIRGAKKCDYASECGITNDLKMSMLKCSGEECSFPYVAIIAGHEEGEGPEEGEEVEMNGLYLLNDGSMIVFPEDGVFLDTNGAKGPNTLGRDIFFLDFIKVYDNYIVTSDAAVKDDHTHSINVPRSTTEIMEEMNGDGDFSCNTNSMSAGQGCAARLLVEGKMDY